MKFILKASSVAAIAVISASAFAAAPNSVTQTAGAEIHWSGKVPMEFSDDGVILTSQGGTPLTEALKGGDIHFLKGATGYDGTFESSSIPLELHYRNCTLADGTVDGSGSVDCVVSGGNYVLGEGADAIGDLITNSAWQLSNVNFNIGGRENPELASTGKILMDGTPMTEGATVVVANGKPVFTTANATAATTLPAPGTRYTVNAAIIASNNI